ncbi:MAG: ATP-binding protein, partial [Planctomyces sp.]|nr:ATP-binding protein [Planctomyces sp.]
MSSQFHLLPSAASLSESLRDIGCSLETATADVIDNSISADATSIQIFCLPNADEPRFAILDDGVGMSLKVVKDAFRHGQI